MSEQETVKKPFQCPACDQGFDSKIELGNHISHRHSWMNATKDQTAFVPASTLIKTTHPITPTKQETVQEPTDAFNSLSLQKSIRKIGQLYPILVDENGEIIDGNHRAEGNPDAEKKIIKVKNRYEALMVRGNAHYRRRVPQEETQQLIVEMAKEAEKMGTPRSEIAKQLVEDLPFSERYIVSLLPTEYKNQQKVEAGRTPKLQNCAEIVQQTVNTPDTKSSPHMEPPARTATVQEGKSTAAHTEGGFEPTENKTRKATPETEQIPPGVPACPCCGASMDPAEYEAVKQTVAVKYGPQIQTLLFPTKEGQTK